MPASNPFGYGQWLNHDGNGGDDISEDVTLGQFNYMTQDLGSQATIVQVFADQNVALVGQNSSQNDGVVGVYGESDGSTRGIGVAGACDKGLGVCGVASTSTVSAFGATQVGVYGVGDNLGVYGQARIVEAQQPTNLPPPTNTGVYGIGDTVGVEGDNDTVNSQGNAGTGVLGVSVQGVGVIGESAGFLDQNGAIAPYIGVYGVSQGALTETSPYPVNSEYLATGVFGLGDVRGGVFQTTPQDEQQVFANIQLTPLTIPFQDIEVIKPILPNLPPRLPKLGKAGDILAAIVQGPGPGEVPGVVQLWVCVLAAKDNKGGALWARINFDAAVLVR